MWIVEDTIRIQYPDGQLLSIPAFEPSRLVAILRSQVPRPAPVKTLAFAWPQQGDVYKAAKERGLEVREREDKRKEREQKKRDRQKAAEELLKIVGL